MILPSVSSLQWLTWASWPRRHWAARLSCSAGAWVVPTETVSCGTLSPAIPCSSRIPGPRRELGGDGEGWVPGPHCVFGLNPSTSYDEDFNHEPCQRKGYKAHWAVSTGGPSLPHPCMHTLHVPSPPRPCILTLPLALCPYSRQGPGLGCPRPNRVLSRDLARSRSLSVNGSRFPWTEAQSTDSRIKQFGLQTWSCRFQAL